MNKGIVDPTQPLNRREFLKTAGALMVGGALSLAAPSLVRGARLSRSRDLLPQHPNFLILITDQERSPQHWPQGWAETSLVNRHTLAQKGLTFRRAFCNTAMCSPSRATLFTGLYPAQHEVKRTLTYNKPISDLESSLPLHLQNMARLLSSVGYHVALKGKWHLSKHTDDDGNLGGPPTENDVARYGFLDWQATTAGEAQDIDGFGGGCANNDEAIAGQAVDFLQNYTASAPFALVASLVNPHDVLAYPNAFDEESCGAQEYQNTANFNHGILLPPSYTLDDLSKKPSAQLESKQLYAHADLGLGPLLTDQQRLNYVNFYADLQKRVDEHIGSILTALEGRGLENDTIVIMLSDHGEMGLAHTGLRQKMYNVYEETIRVPLVVSNPLLFPNPIETGALASLVDVLPTVVALANVPNPDQCVFRGLDLSPIIDDAVAHPGNPIGAVQDSVLFTFDDEDAGTGYNLEAFIHQPNHIRCIRCDLADGEWKYARYFDPMGQQPEQHEMYHLLDSDGNPVDPDELDNLGNEAQYPADQYPEIAAKRSQLAQKLGVLEAGRLDPLPKVMLPIIK